MDVVRFDALTRTLGAGASRRGILGGVLAALGLGALAPADGAAKKKNTKKAKKNAFGCLNVGQQCRGKDRKCCSGICQGKKPKLGKRDRSKCVAHDESTCQPGQQAQECGGAIGVLCTTTAGQPGQCSTTTGNAPYCFADGDCFPCKRDSDCEGVCGPQAACIQCATTCSGTGGTACFGPSACTF
jgi:hypothetical protein